MTDAVSLSSEDDDLCILGVILGPAVRRQRGKVSTGRGVGQSVVCCRGKLGCAAAELTPGGFTRRRASRIHARQPLTPVLPRRRFRTSPALLHRRRARVRNFPVSATRLHRRAGRQGRDGLLRAKKTFNLDGYVDLVEDDLGDQDDAVVLQTVSHAAAAAAEVIEQPRSETAASVAVEPLLADPLFSSVSSSNLPGYQRRLRRLVPTRLLPRLPIAKRRRVTIQRDAAAVGVESSSIGSGADAHGAASGGITECKDVLLASPLQPSSVESGGLSSCNLGLCLRRCVSSSSKPSPAWEAESQRSSPSQCQSAQPLEKEQDENRAVPILPAVFSIPLPEDRPSRCTRIPEEEQRVPLFFGVSDVARSPEPKTDSSGESGWISAQFFLERLRSSATPELWCRCKTCSFPFGAGQVRLGWLPKGSPELPASVRWIHAPRCVMAEKIIAEQGVDVVAVGPGIEAELRERVLALLSMLGRSGGEVEPCGLQPVAWSYEAARPRHIGPRWTELPVPTPGGTRRPLPGRTRDDSPIPSDILSPSSTDVRLSHSARAARDVIAHVGRLHRERFQSRLSPIRELDDDDRNLSERPRVDRTLPRQSETDNDRSRMRDPGEQSGGQRAVPGWLALLRRAAPSLTILGTAEEPCVICRDAMVPGDKVRRLPCLHMFHASCLERWARVRPVCPLDKISIEDLASQGVKLARSPLTQTGVRPAVDGDPFDGDPLE